MIWSINFALCGICFALGVAWARRKPEPGWKAIAGRQHAEMEREYSFEQEANSQAMREYEDANRG